MLLLLVHWQVELPSCGKRGRGEGLLHSNCLCGMLFLSLEPERETYTFFPRGLQGSYNAYTTKRNLHVPHGDVLVFSLA